MDQVVWAKGATMKRRRVHKAVVMETDPEPYGGGFEAMCLETGEMTGDASTLYAYDMITGERCIDRAVLALQQYNRCKAEHVHA